MNDYRRMRFLFFSRASIYVFLGIRDFQGHICISKEKTEIENKFLLYCTKFKANVVKSQAQS